MKHVYYCAIGAKYAEMARVSAASVRRYTPNIIITLLTDQPVETGEFDRVVSAKDDFNDIVDIKLARISMLDRVETERALYLDCDTLL